MKRNLQFLIYALFILFALPLQIFASDWQIKKGESLTYFVAFHSGLTGNVKAGKATLSVLPQTEKINSQSVYHAVLKGESTGIVNWFYDINNRYESYMSTSSLDPIMFVQDVKENKYTKKDTVYFDHARKVATVDGKAVSMISGAQDFVSMLYVVRKMNFSSMTEGDKFILPLFSDRKVVKSNVKYIGKETIKTQYGTHECYGLQPQVAKGKMFKDSYPATIWITADENRYPMLVEAKLKVGSIKLELEKSN